MSGFVIRFIAFIPTLWPFRAVVGSDAVFAPLTLTSLLETPALRVPILAFQQSACCLVHRCLGFTKPILGIIADRVGVVARFDMRSLAELEEAILSGVVQESIDSIGEGQAGPLVENQLDLREFWKKALQDNGQ